MANEQTSRLRQRFLDLWARNLRPGNPNGGDAVFDDLVSRYCEPHRRYHGWTHLTHCLRHFDPVADQLHAPDAVEMALWFHDAVYKPGSQDNESESAALFEHFAAEALVSDHVALVKQYILLTRHQAPPRDTDGCFVVDIDLSPLAARWSDYLTDSENIRWEAPQVSDEAFFPAQRAFLQAMLARPTLFRTEWFSSRFEAVARENMTRFVERLEDAGYR